MNSVERVKAICKERKIPISKLESDLKFGNGYIGQLRKGVFPADRIVKIADYLGVTTDYLLTGEKEKAPTDGEHEITFDDFTYAMQNESKDLTEADKQILLSMAKQPDKQILLSMAKQLNYARKKKNGESN